MKAFGLLSLLILNCSFNHALSKDIHSADQITKKEFNPSTILWYDTAATKWEEALPVGNGRLGAMVFTRVELSN